MNAPIKLLGSDDSPFSKVRVSRPQVTPSLRLRFSLLLALFCLLTGPRSQAAELLQNGGFSSALDHWSLPIPLVKKNWNPLVNGTVQLHPPGSFLGYVDDVIYQPLNVSGVSGKTVTASLKLRKSYGDAHLKTIAVFLEYVTTGNAVERVLAFEASNALVTDLPDEWTSFQEDVTLPGNARKLTRFIIAKQNWGDFIADDASLFSPDLVAGPVPHIAEVSGSGQYGAPMTLTGTDLGLPPASLTLNDSAIGLTPLTWTDTSIEVVVAEPALPGVPRIVQDFTESWGGTTYHLTSPTFIVSTDDTPIQLVRGSKAKWVVQVDFLNGFTSPLGMTFTVPEAPAGTAVFNPLPLRNSGGVLLTLDTTTLAAGDYEWTIQSTEATSLPRTARIRFTVHTVASVAFIQSDTVVTSLNVNTQGEIFIGFELRNSSGDRLPNEGCLFTSTAPHLLQALAYTSNGPYRLFSQEEGSATLRVTAPDGFIADLPITIAGLSPNRMTHVSFTNPTPSNSGTSSTRFSASAPTNITGWGTEGLLEIDPPDAFDAISFGGTSIQSDPFSVAEGQMPNVFLASASSAGGTRYATLTVINSPAHGAISGRVSSLDGFHGAEGMLEFFALDDDSAPVLTRNIHNWQGPDFSAGAIPPGSYKVRLVSGFSGSTQFYPNTTSFDDAQVLVFTAGQTLTGIDFFAPPSDLRITSQPVDQTVGIGQNAAFQVVAQGAYGPFTYQWKRDGIDLVDDATISGADTDTLTLSNAQVTDSNALFSVVITDTNTSEVVSRSALLKVGDFDPPLVNTLPTTDAQALVRAARAVVVGQVNPNGLLANVEVHWGTKADTLNRTAAATPSVVTGSSLVTLTAELTGLAGNTTYFFRFQAASSVGVTQGAVLSFKTPVAVPPIVKTLPAGAPTHDSALVSGTVDPRGAETTVFFDYGTTASFGATMVANPPMVSGSSVQPVSGFLTGLLPHTKYFYRLRAESDNGAAVGTTLSFTTVNRPVVAHPDSFALLPSGRAVLDVLGNDMDPDGDPLAIESFTQPPVSVGRVSRSGSDLLFTPSAVFSGGSFTYKVKDGFGSSAQQTVTLTRASCSISPELVTLPAAGGTHSVNVTTTAPWSVVESLSWASAEPGMIGNGQAIITIAPNPSTASRTGVLVIGGETHTVVQNGVLAPQISVPDVIPAGIVSGSYHLVIPTVNFPVTYSVTGLPKGLKFDQANGIIHGKPLLAGNYRVFISARNRAGLTSRIDFEIAVSALPAHAVGSFSAIIERSPEMGVGIGGAVSFTTTGTGAVSGTLRLGTGTHRFKGVLDAPLVGAPMLDLIVPRKNQQGIQLAFTLEDTMDGPTIAGTVRPDLPGSSSTPIVGGSHPWSAAQPATAYATYYTVSLEPEDDTDETRPQGAGFLALTVKANGMASWKGKLADGTALTGSVSLWGTGQIPLYAPLYKGQGSLLGLPVITPRANPLDPASAADIGGTVSWLKLAQSTRTYASGFGPTELFVRGGQYYRPARGENVLGFFSVEPENTNGILELTGGRIEDSQFGTSLTQQFRITPAHKATFSSDPMENPARVRLTSLNSTTGLFTGTLTLSDENPDRDFVRERRTVTFQGVLISDEAVGAGFFLLNELSVPPATPVKMPQWSGRVAIF
jgi:hypothetical protein